MCLWECWPFFQKHISEVKHWSCTTLSVSFTHSAPNSLMLVFMDLALSSGAQTISQVFSQNSLKCIGTLKQEEVLPLELRGEHNSWKIMLHNNSPKLYTWHRIPLAVTEPCFRAFVASCLTPLHPTLCIVLDVSLGCSCSAIETQSVKLSVDCSWANLTVTWSLESCSDELCASASADLTLWLYMAYHFMVEFLSVASVF